MITVGIPVIPYEPAVEGFSSTFSLNTLTLFFIFSPILSIIGPTILQGPHQGAQKSTNTGISEFKTSSLKVASVVSLAIRSSFLFVYKHLPYMQAICQ